MRLEFQQVTRGRLPTLYPLLFKTLIVYVTAQKSQRCTFVYFNTWENGWENKLKLTDAT
jgi:hypothetical protein